MNGLNTIVKNNNAAVAAHVAGTSPKHVVNAPPTENFDYNIPWQFSDGTLHVWLHRDTRVTDTIKLVQHVAKIHGVKFNTKEHRYS